jgi:abortive infection bacteriophage resistance protein
MRARVSAVNYYRLSGYWYPFRNPDDTFKAGTTFEAVWRRYVFDRRLRLLVMDAVERLEVAVRSQLAYHHAHQHGPFAYASEIASLPKLRPSEYQEFVEREKATQTVLGRRNCCAGIGRKRKWRNEN